MKETRITKMKETRMNGINGIDYFYACCDIKY